MKVLDGNLLHKLSGDDDYEEESWQEWARKRDALLKGALRGEKCVRGDRIKAAKDLFDFVRTHPNLCEAILFELERAKFEEKDYWVAWQLREPKRESKERAKGAEANH